MRICVNNLKFNIDREPDLDALTHAVAKTVRTGTRDVSEISILKKSIDARDKANIRYVYTVGCDVKNAEQILKDGRIRNVSRADAVEYKIPDRTYNGRPVIIGAGPAGLFCAFILVEAGITPIIVERGADVDRRKEDVEAFWRDKVLRPDSNVQFGEGGAGAFSDGKLNTLIKDKTGRCRYVLETLVRFGAPANILYDAKPHIGTDILTGTVRSMREYLCDRGCEIRFNTRVSDIQINAGKVRGVVCESRHTGENGDTIGLHNTYELNTDRVILALGHSARDTFEMLDKKSIVMEPKPFAVGLRIEHPREFIDISQYGERGASILPAADYKLTAQTSSGRGVYSFCMCPGGYVVNASSEEGMIAVNGMSYSGRSGDNSNSAIIVTVTPEDFNGEGNLSGVAFQRELERKAYELGNGRVPFQRYGDYVSCIKARHAGNFADDIISDALSDISFGKDFVPNTKGMNAQADISSLLPGNLPVSLIEGMARFGHLIHGFNSADAYLSGVESRTSSPVKILRGDDGMSIGLSGLYPCGEGAGYAGGITSAAMDGIFIAEKVLVE